MGKKGKALVAMVGTRGSGVLLCFVMLMLSGCVIGHGPTLANALDVNLDVIRRTADGEIRNITFKPGMMAGVGKGDWDKKKWKKDGTAWDAIPIEEVVIKEAGQLLHQFNAEEVRLLIEKQDSESGWWCIGRERVNLVLTYDYHDPDARKGCSKGKRLWTWENGRFYKGSSESP